MPAQIKMKLYNNNQNYLLSATRNLRQVPNTNILLESNTKRKCKLLFLQGNKHCSSCSGK